MPVQPATPGAEYDQLCRELDPPLVQAVELCALPHSLDDTLGYQILHKFANLNGTARRIWSELKQLPFVYPSEGEQWRFAQSARTHFVTQLEKQEEVYLALNRYLTNYFSVERERIQQVRSPQARELEWQIAYHLAPIAPDEAVERLRHFGEEAARANRLADVKSVIDIFDEQKRWLSAYQVERAYFEGSYAYAKHNHKVAEEKFALVWKQGPKNEMKAAAGHLLGVIWAKRANHLWLTRAEKILRRTLALDIRLNNKYQEAMVLNTLGGVLVRFGGRDQLREAEELYRRSLDLRRDLKDLRGEAMVLNSLGGVLLDMGGQGRLQEAEELYRRSLEIGESFGIQAHQAMALNSLGGVLVKLGGTTRLQEAEALYRRSLELEKNLKNSRGEAIVLNSLGGVLVKLGGTTRLREAEALYRRSLELRRNLKDIRSEAMVLNALGSVLVKLGAPAEMKEAEELYQRSLELLRDLRDHRGEAMVLQGLANWAEASGNVALACKYVEQMIAIDEMLGNQHFVKKNRERLTRLQRQLKK